jgi:serine protease Do
MKRQIRTPLALAITAALAFSIGLTFEPRVGTPAHAADAATPVSATAASMHLPDFSGLVRRYGPAVVNISVSGTTRTAMTTPLPPGMDRDDPLFRFFGFGGPMQPQRPQPTRGQGSGFIVSADGVILTNAHVVDGATTVTVKLTDRREFVAKVLGTDPRTDVAVLKIDARNLPTVELGDSRALEVGQWVVAIGSPFGFENSVTQGIVSAKSRSLPDEGAVPFIQTDVAVNPGNSGGPLFDLEGRVVGINSQIFSRTGGYQGVSFAIPIDVALNVRRQIVDNGTVRHGRLGVGVQTLNQELAQAFGREHVDGAAISKVEPGSAAEKAGLKAGDVLLSVDGAPVRDSGEVAATIAAKMPGDRVALEVWRDHKTQKLTAILDGDDEGTVALTDESDSDTGRLGLSVRALTPDEARGSGIAEGVVVEDVSGRAADAGILPGDVVLGVNGRKVRSASELRDAVGDKGSSVALLVQRGDARLFVPVGAG